MNYLISDIHGNLEAFKRLLAEAEFSNDDNLFVVGGIVDNGHESIELIKDLMLRDNVFPIMGYHEFSLLRFLKNMQKKANGEEISSKSNEAVLKWFSDGGAETAQKVLELPEEERDAICDYLEDMDVFLELEIDDVSYVLAPGGIRHYSSDKELEDYDYKDMINTKEADTNISIPGVTLVTGAFPLRNDDGSLVAQITVKPGHIMLDCGAACGGRLGMYCIETGESFYEDV